MAVLGVDVGGTKLLMLAGEPGNPRSRKVATGPDFTPAQLKQALAAFIQAALDAAQRHSLEDLWNACSITRSGNPEQMAALGAQRFAAR
ncbi:hypothetical protein ACP3VQ_12335 [Metapseudomonas otitidis]|uniref:hypothetical protein n=1 Tax=Metapseudomonas otitidis TaxID=319939 RepID=UPI003CF1FC08